MAKNRYSGRAGTVSVESTSAGWIAVGLTPSISPPPMEKAAIDCTAMEDATVVVEQGIEQQSAMTFTCLQATTDAADTLIQAYYTNATDRPWRVGRKNGSLTWYSSFNGLITSINPQSFGGNDPATMDVEVVRTSAITESTPA